MCAFGALLMRLLRITGGAVAVAGKLMIQLKFLIWIRNNTLPQLNGVH